MRNKEGAAQTGTKTLPLHRGESSRVTIAEARRKAFEASEKARQAQVAYADEEAKRWYDYKVEE